MSCSRLQKFSKIPDPLQCVGNFRSESTLVVSGDQRATDHAMPQHRRYDMRRAAKIAANVAVMRRKACGVTEATLISFSIRALQRGQS